MAFTKDELRAYARGYNAGATKKWPTHKPPAPPDELVAAMLCAARSLRDAVDAACATFSEEDEFVRTLDAPIDQFDDAMSKWTAWLLDYQKDPS